MGYFDGIGDFISSVANAITAGNDEDALNAFNDKKPQQANKVESDPSSSPKNSAERVRDALFAGNDNAALGEFNDESQDVVSSPEERKPTQGDSTRLSPENKPEIEIDKPKEVENKEAIVTVESGTSSPASVLTKTDTGVSHFREDQCGTNILFFLNPLTEGKELFLITDYTKGLIFNGLRTGFGIQFLKGDVIPPEVVRVIEFMRNSKTPVIASPEDKALALRTTGVDKIQLSIIQTSDETVTITLSGEENLCIELPLLQGERYAKYFLKKLFQSQAPFTTTPVQSNPNLLALEERESSYETYVVDPQNVYLQNSQLRLPGVISDTTKRPLLFSTPTKIINTATSLNGIDTCPVIVTRSEATSIALKQEKPFDSSATSISLSESKKKPPQKEVDLAIDTTEQSPLRDLSPKGSSQLDSPLVQEALPYSIADRDDMCYERECRLSSQEDQPVLDCTFRYSNGQLVFDPKTIPVSYKESEATKLLTSPETFQDNSSLATRYESAGSLLSRAIREFSYPSENEGKIVEFINKGKKGSRTSEKANGDTGINSWRWLSDNFSSIANRTGLILRDFKNLLPESSQQGFLARKNPPTTQTVQITPKITLSYPVCKKESEPSFEARPNQFFTETNRECVINFATRKDVTSRLAPYVPYANFKLTNDLSIEDPTGLVVPNVDPRVSMQFKTRADGTKVSLTCAASDPLGKVIYKSTEVSVAQARELMQLVVTEYDQTIASNQVALIKKLEAFPEGTTLFLELSNNGFLPLELNPLLDKYLELYTPTHVEGHTALVRSTSDGVSSNYFLSINPQGNGKVKVSLIGGGTSASITLSIQEVARALEKMGESNSLLLAQSDRLALGLPSEEFGVCDVPKYSNTSLSTREFSLQSPVVTMSELVAESTTKALEQTVQITPNITLTCPVRLQSGKQEQSAAVFTKLPAFLQPMPRIANGQLPLSSLLEQFRAKGGSAPQFKISNRAAMTPARPSQFFINTNDAYRLTFCSFDDVPTGFIPYIPAKDQLITTGGTKAFRELVASKREQTIQTQLTCKNNEVYITSVVPSQSGEVSSTTKVSLEEGKDLMQSVMKGEENDQTIASNQVAFLGETTPIFQGKGTKIDVTFKFGDFIPPEFAPIMTIIAEKMQSQSTTGAELALLSKAAITELKLSFLQTADGKIIIAYRGTKEPIYFEIPKDTAENALQEILVRQREQANEIQPLTLPGSFEVFGACDHQEGPSVAGSTKELGFLNQELNKHQKINNNNKRGHEDQAMRIISSSHHASNLRGENKMPGIQGNQCQNKGVVAALWGAITSGSDADALDQFRDCPPGEKPLESREVQVQENKKEDKADKVVRTPVLFQSNNQICSASEAPKGNLTLSQISLKPLVIGGGEKKDAVELNSGTTKGPKAAPSTTPKPIPSSKADLFAIPSPRPSSLPRGDQAVVAGQASAIPVILKSNGSREVITLGRSTPKFFEEVGDSIRFVFDQKNPLHVRLVYAFLENAKVSGNCETGSSTNELATFGKPPDPGFVGFTVIRVSEDTTKWVFNNGKNSYETKTYLKDAELFFKNMSSQPLQKSLLGPNVSSQTVPQPGIFFVPENSQSQIFNLDMNLLLGGVALTLSGAAGVGIGQLGTPPFAAPFALPTPLIGGLPTNVEQTVPGAGIGECAVPSYGFSIGNTGAEAGTSFVTPEASSVAQTAATSAQTPASGAQSPESFCDVFCNNYSPYIVKGGIVISSGTIGLQRLSQASADYKNGNKLNAAFNTALGITLVGLGAWAAYRV